MKAARNWGEKIAALHVAAALVLGCELDQRKVDAIQPFGPNGGAAESTMGNLQPQSGADATAPGSSTEGAPDPSGLDGNTSEADLGAQLSLGSACALGSECASGSCADGVCCENACGDVCVACNVAGNEGRCVPVPSDPQCRALICPARTACRFFGSAEIADNCNGAGSCKMEAACEETLEPAGTPCADGQGQCDGAGQCQVEGKNRLGEACASDDECAEGHCVTGDLGVAACCDQACDGLCQRCGADGRCNAFPEDDASCPVVQCPPDNICRDYDPGFFADRCIGNAVCAAVTDCDFQELRPAPDCSCSGSGCLLSLGANCAVDAECQGGFCVGNVCCNRACQGACEQCAAPSGLCGPIAGCECSAGATSSCGAIRGSRGACAERVITCTAAGRWPTDGCGPLGPEVCDGALGDEDCDGQIEEGCNCVSGDVQSCGIIHGSRGDCASRSVTCDAGGQWPAPSACAPAGAEQCDAGRRDEDCDGQFNEGCQCNSGAVQTCGSALGSGGECAARSVTCGADGRFPAASCAAQSAESCDASGRDEDCDGQSNEGCECVNGQLTTCGAQFGARGQCAARTLTCTGGRWPAQANCTTTNAELCDDDFLDEDCDGLSNETPPCQGFVSITAPEGTACAISTDGRLYCWGQNDAGLVGDNTTVNRTLPKEVQGLTGVQSVLISNTHACAMLAGGNARCWGSNARGGIGDGTDTGVRLTPTPVTVVTGVRSIAPAIFASCALFNNNSVSCWGLSGSFTPGVIEVVPITGLTTNVSSITVGLGFHQCALMSNGTVRCWGGLNDDGELGVAPGPADQRVSVLVNGVANATRVIVGSDHSCALRANGQVLCWGDNTDGQLGDGSTVDRSTPAPVLDLPAAIEIAAGYNRTCAIATDRTLYCWGFGTGSRAPRLVTGEGLSDLATVTTGFFATCVVRRDGAAFCFGDNSNGALGNPGANNLSRTTPFRVLGP